jgi:hypothetical protein
LGWNGFGLPDTVWAVVMIIAGFLIASAVMLKNRDFAYGLVVIWAYLGILMKHASADGFAGQYPAVITTVIICLFFLIAAEVYLLIFSRKTARIR